jgi:hypothetical protein
MFFIVVAYIPGVLWKQKRLWGGFVMLMIYDRLMMGIQSREENKGGRQCEEKCEFFSCLLFSGRIQQKDVEFTRVLH